MRLYVKKISDNKIVVFKETTTQSILSDIMTIAVLVLLFALDIAFSLIVTHSFVFDLLVVLMLFVYFQSKLGEKKRVFTSKIDAIDAIAKDIKS